MNEPKPSPLRKRLVLGGAVLLSLVLTLVIGNAVLAARRTLHVINGTPAPLKVEVGGASVEVAPGEHATLTLAEGEHEARFGESTLRFTIEGSFFERSLGGSAFVLNPYAAAALRWEEGTFGPRAGEGRPERILLGSFHTFRSVDLPFQPFPAQSAVPALTRVDYALGKSGVILGESVPTAGSLDYAEYHLWRSSGSTLLAAYLDRARKLKARARARTFLADGLEREPLDVPWHRSYQDLARRELGRAELERTYGVRSAAAPQSHSA